MEPSSPSVSSASSSRSWIELLEGKQWSRLLYTNPVCFLCTTCNTTLKRNVMVLSWLTATNNRGGMMFSINRRRFTAQALLSSSRSETTNSANQRFVLAVPTADMEDLVRNVGSVSGVYGISKFPDDHNHQVDEGSVSSNKKRKKGRPKFPHGIPGLRAVPVGQQSPDKTKGEDAFAIQGTISHLVCCVDKVMEEDALDDEHYLVIAHVERAFVHSSYFDTNKNLFRPQDDTIAPYLTFFGSQTFGYVVSNKQSTTDIA